MRPLAVLLAVFSLPAGAQFLRGVNMAGAEFGSDKIPGTVNRDYTYNSENSYRYFAVRNLNLVRLPVLWERMQPQLRGPLDRDALAAVKRCANWARSSGTRLIIDIHNYGRYRIVEESSSATHAIGGGRVSTEDLIDLWVKLSAEFRDDTAVHAYGLMNEPHDMPVSWKEVSQAVLSAIRAAGDNKLILVPGDSWSSANRWASVHGPSSWIADPANNFAYEAHAYFDRNESGTYTQSFDTELKADPDLANVGARRIAPFVAWCRANNVKGFLGEFGVPDSDPRWLEVLDRFLKVLDSAGFDGTYWAAGEWWGNYALSVQPRNSYTVDRPQMSAILGHLPQGLLTSVSAASNGGFTFAPDSLVSAYGTGLPAGNASVEVSDSAGSVRSAQVLYSSPVQVNYLVPPGTAPGRAEVRIAAGGKQAGSGTIYVDRVAPTIFPIAQLVRVSEAGTKFQTVTPDDPIEWGNDRAFLVFYGTGFRAATAVTLRFGTTTAQVAYAGAQGEFPGLDQLNVEIPSSLAGTGKLTVAIQADGKNANPLTLWFR